MTEWLDENARRAYPLERELPAGVPKELYGVLLDAAVGTDLDQDDGRLTLLSVAMTEAGKLSVEIGCGAEALSAQLAPAGGRTAVHTLLSEHIKAFLTVGNEALSRIVGNPAYDGMAWEIGVPFSVRCTSYACKRVTAIEAYTPEPEEACAHPVFAGEERTPVATITGDVVLRAGDGVDLETAASPDGEGTALRVSAIAGEIDEGASAKTEDIVIRGDQCIAVEARPGVKVNQYGDETPDPRYGLVVLGSKCKPCCQCDDYMGAVKTLRPYENMAAAIKRDLDKARDAYVAAAEAFDDYKKKALEAANSYANINATAVAVCSSSSLYDGATTAEGTRSRIAITLTVENMTQDTATLSELTASCENYAEDRVSWTTAGSRSRTGQSVAKMLWRLGPGDTLVASWTFVKTSKTNRAPKPKMSVTARVKLDHQNEPFPLSPEVK